MSDNARQFESTSQFHLELISLSERARQNQLASIAICVHNAMRGIEFVQFEVDYKFFIFRTTYSYHFYVLGIFGSGILVFNYQAMNAFSSVFSFFFKKYYEIANSKKKFEYFS